MVEEPRPGEPFDRGGSSGVGRDLPPSRSAPSSERVVETYRPAEVRPLPAGQAASPIAEDTITQRIESTRNLLRDAHQILDDLTGGSSAEPAKSPEAEGLSALSNDVALLAETLRDRIAQLRLTLGRL